MKVYFWHVFISFDGWLDNNVFVRAKSEKEAIKIAMNFVDEEGEWR